MVTEAGTMLYTIIIHAQVAHFKKKERGHTHKKKNYGNVLHGGEAEFLSDPHPHPQINPNPLSSLVQSQG